MKKLYYPVLFHPEESGYSVRVPDLDGCLSQGETVEEAVEMIQDAIGLYLEDVETVPVPSRPESVRTAGNDFLMLVPDEVEYKRNHDTKSVKKTLTIPAWLNDAAESAHINFSSVLQTGLKKQLNLE